PTAQGLFHAWKAPRHGAHAARGDSGGANGVAADVERDRRRRQGEFEGLAVPYLEIAGAPGLRSKWHLDCHDELAGPQIVLVLRRAARRTEKVRQLNSPFAPTVPEDDGGVECDEGHGEIRRVGGHALIAGTENRVGAVAALDRRTPGAGGAAVARG